MNDQIEIHQLVEHLFRHEAGKITSVLTRIFGTAHLELAEDIVQDTLIEAIQQWTYKGVPDNPSAWLYKVARNKTLNVIQREKYAERYASDFIHFMESPWTAEPALEHLFSEEEILDDQLRMMFMCCHPAVSGDSQIALTLKTLCGFSIREIAKAFLTTEENIHKRLVRARKTIREKKLSFNVPNGQELEHRLDTILETIYLLFNEGYNASVGEELIRYELCEEAIRLTELILSHPAFNKKSLVYALLALMQLNASRFNTRLDETGNILTLEHQNRSSWNYELMEKGFSNLQKSSDNESAISAYHLLATISAYHCSAKEYSQTDWNSILTLYDRLVEINHSPVILLNRSVAFSKVYGAGEAIREIETIKNVASLQTNYLLFSTQAEFYLELNEYPTAAAYFGKAISLAPLPLEKRFLQKRLEFCQEKII